MIGAYEIAEAFRGFFAASNDFPGTACNHEQTSEKRTVSGLVFAVTTKPIDPRGKALVYTLTVWVESHVYGDAPSDPATAPIHGALVTAVNEQLLGAGKAALLNYLNTLGTFDFRGWSIGDGDPGLEGHHFRTPVVINGTVLVL